MAAHTVAAKIEELEEEDALMLLLPDESEESEEGVADYTAKRRLPSNTVSQPRKKARVQASKETDWNAYYAGPRPQSTTCTRANRDASATIARLESELEVERAGGVSVEAKEKMCVEQGAEILRLRAEKEKLQRERDILLSALELAQSPMKRHAMPVLVNPDSYCNNQEVQSLKAMPNTNAQGAQIQGQQEEELIPPPIPKTTRISEYAPPPSAADSSPWAVWPIPDPGVVVTKAKRSPARTKSKSGSVNGASDNSSGSGTVMRSAIATTARALAIPTFPATIPTIEPPLHKDYAYVPNANPKAADYVESVENLINRACADYFSRILTVDAFPSKILRNEWARESWDNVNDEAQATENKRYTLTDDITSLITKRGPSFVATDSDDVQSTDANRLMAKSFIKDSAFCYADPETRTGFGGNAILAAARAKNSVFTENAKQSGYFDPFPIPYLALEFTVLEHLVSEWATGTQIMAQFQGEKMASKYPTQMLEGHISATMSLDVDLIGELEAPIQLQDKRHPEAGVAASSLKRKVPSEPGDLPRKKTRVDLDANASATIARLESENAELRVQLAAETGRRASVEAKLKRAMPSATLFLVDLSEPGSSYSSLRTCSSSQPISTRDL
ncbi:hypothetical protein FB45DRAFT_1033829 [Roridomyces roridus]|uniref:DUF6532 domain-containing protein n=1 Tax=Roridomyces roridus TaxID=1738132 RepID=A0AAD7BEQ4_9AGAR|nr:hypothetical protein FB45DRAFT_1033829 [Roridomyces roridus]